MRQNKRKAVIIALSAVALLGAMCLVLYLARVSRYQKTVRNMVISRVALAQVADGVYTGDCDVGLIYAKVAVTVEQGKITDIALLEHRNGRGTPAESVLDQILAQQRLDVDTVTGATNSSKVLQKAVENALTNP